MAKEIQLTMGYVAIVDDDDFDYVSSHKWHAIRNGFRVCGRRFTREGTSLFMHRDIMGAPTGSVVDHINGNSLDNRRSNLRLCTMSQNVLHRLRTRKRGTSSKFKNVHYDARTGRWNATITIDGKKRHLGGFPTEQEAAAAFDVAAKAAFGSFAVTNESGGPPPMRLVVYEEMPEYFQGNVLIAEARQRRGDMVCATCFHAVRGGENIKCALSQLDEPANGFCHKWERR